MVWFCGFDTAVQGLVVAAAVKNVGDTNLAGLKQIRDHGRMLERNDAQPRPQVIAGGAAHSPRWRSGAAGRH